MSSNDQQGYMESAKDKLSNAWESTKETAAAGAQKVADKALDAKDRMSGVNRDNSEGATNRAVSSNTAASAVDELEHFRSGNALNL